jgi:photosynthetic reaction center cytochrome c subunit
MPFLIGDKFRRRANLWLFLVVALVCVSLMQARVRTERETKQASVPQQSQASEPTGADRCLFCHPTEVEGFSRSAMAHALRRAAQEPDGIVSAHGSTITMHNANEGFYQRWENAGDQREYRVDYVIGSGEHASGYLIDIGGHLFQSPVAYYKSRGAYDLAPGYEDQPDPDFTRPISEECLLCHSGRALHIPGTLNQYRSPAFAAESITCERCHGPAEKHLADPRAGTIINPSRLETAARDSVCEQCHLFGVARVPNPGKKISDFVPGMPLEETFTIYRNVMPAGTPAGDFKVISHVEQLALSSCVRNSGGRLWCATCHNPHEKLAKNVEYYRSRCLSCHTSNFEGSHPAKDSDCLTCHMPRRDAKDGGHTVFTDHRIQRTPDVPVDLPPNSGIAAWREPSPDLQKRNLGIAYIDVGMQRHSGPFIIQGYRNLAEVQGQFSNDPELFKWIGEALLLGKQNADAELAFEHALQLDPNSAQSLASAAAPYVQEGNDALAVSYLERAIALDPLFLPAASTLLDLYKKEGKSVEAAELSAKINAAMAERPTPPAPKSRPAEEIFKNIQVQKGTAADQVIPSMQFISSALGVECTFCHVDGHFEKDDKKPKLRAREMMRMTFALNNGSFEGRREITCYSCHRGVAQPVATPTVDALSSSERSASTPDLAVALPTSDQLLDRYVDALGGAASMRKITSRVERGTIEVSGKSVAVEMFIQSPGKWALVRSLPQGKSINAFDGQTGWVSMAGRTAREMARAEIEAVRMDANLQFPLQIRDAFPELRVGYSEQIGERHAYVLFGRKGEQSAKLYFDQASGLLLRIVRYSDAPLGINPSQVDYADYREVDGVQVPFQLTLYEPGSASTIHLQEVLQNVAIDEAIFAKPMAESDHARK